MYAGPPTVKTVASTLSVEASPTAVTLEANVNVCSAFAEAGPVVDGGGRVLLVPSTSTIPEEPRDTVAPSTVYAGPPAVNVIDPMSRVDESPLAVRVEAMVKVWIAVAGSQRLTIESSEAAHGMTASVFVVDCAEAACAATIASKVIGSLKEGITVVETAVKIER